jgi:hypothetical protein
MARATAASGTAMVGIPHPSIAIGPVATSHPVISARVSATRRCTAWPGFM